MGPAEGRAAARTALAGNPSDGYGGAVLALELPELKARVVARPTERVSVAPASELVTAATRRLSPGGALIEWSTTIPQGVGLGGSSAIVIATLRALCELRGVALEPPELAAVAYAVEREDLGIAGGRQDQVVQAFGGLVLMEFAHDRHQRLDPALLPPLVIAWRADSAESSGVVHADLRERHATGEPEVLAAMAELAGLAHDAARGLEDRDHERFAGAVDRTFEIRRELLALDPRHIAMIDCARRHGASANYSGSGGAIVAVCRDEPQREEVAGALAEDGGTVLSRPARRGWSWS
jgi:glucuronokinase